MIKAVGKISVSELFFDKEPYIWESPLAGLLVISRPFYPDTRGSFQENIRVPDIEETVGRPVCLLQFSTSEMAPRTIKGIHCERQDKLLQPVLGEFVFVEVDLRPESPTFKQWIMLKVSAGLGKRRRFLFVPAGFGNSMAITGKQTAILNYATSSVYSQEEAKRVVRYDDPDLAIPWAVKNPIVSNRDLGGMSLDDFLRRNQ